MTSENVTPEPCARCQVGQGDDCHCRGPIDNRAVRWLSVGMVVFWGLVATLVRSCA